MHGRRRRPITVHSSLWRSPLSRHPRRNRQVKPSRVQDLVRPDYSVGRLARRSGARLGAHDLLRANHAHVPRSNDDNRQQTTIFRYNFPVSVRTTGVVRNVKTGRVVYTKSLTASQLATGELTPVSSDGPTSTPPVSALRPVLSDGRRVQLDYSVRVTIEADRGTMKQTRDRHTR